MSEILNASNIQIANTIRVNLSLDYQQRVPELTRNNIEQVFTAITSYEPSFNAFNAELVNKIGMSYITRRDKFENPLREFKKGMMPFGSTVEEIYVGLVKSKVFDPDTASETVFKRDKGFVKTLYHSMNRQDKYQITISEDELRTAFFNEYGLNDLITRKYDSLFESDSLDEFMIMKEVISNLYTNGGFYPVIVDEVVDKDTAEKLVIQMRAIASKLTFIKTEYNPMKVPTRTMKSNQIVLLSPETEAYVDVTVLAQAFNMGKAEITGRIVVVDDFSSDSDTDMSNVQAMVVDKEVWQVWDKLFKVADIYNPDGLYWNAFLHHWQIMSYSLFANAVVFTKAITATAITLNQASATVKKGNKQQFTAVVTGDPSNTVKWEISGNQSESTYIDGCGTLYVAKDESGTSITVKATSAYTSSVTKTATVTVQA